MSEYRMLKPQNELRILGLYSLHYFQFAQGYVFSGEKHNFWEMVYIDRGEAEIGADRNVLQLHQGQLLFHKPGEFHSIWANFAEGANLFVTSFACSGAAMRELIGKQFTLRSDQRRIIARIIAEGRHAFGDVLDISAQKELRLLPDAPRGCTQMITLYLTQLLLSLLREPAGDSLTHAQPRLTDEAAFAETLASIRALMLSRLDGSLRFGEICTAVGQSETALKKHFQHATGTSVMDYYRHLRLEEARRMLRDGRMNVSEISDCLGYPNVGAFSRQFRRVLGLTPTAYQRSVNG